jgi:outer membrane protein assembly factor BamB
MKTTLLMIAVVALLVGCGKKEPVQPLASNTKATKPEPTKVKAAAVDKLWEFETGGRVRSSPAIGSDGTVYVGVR